MGCKNYPECLNNDSRRRQKRERKKERERRQSSGRDKDVRGQGRWNTLTVLWRHKSLFGLLPLSPFDHPHAPYRHATSFYTCLLSRPIKMFPRPMPHGGKGFLKELFYVYNVRIRQCPSWCFGLDFILAFHFLFLFFFFFPVIIAVSVGVSCSER